MNREHLLRNLHALAFDQSLQHPLRETAAAAAYHLEFTKEVLAQRDGAIQNRNERIYSLERQNARMALRAAEASGETLSEAEVVAMETALQRHYKEPVRPVSRYCDAFRSWRTVIGELLARPDVSDSDKAIWSPVLTALDMLVIPIAKSNLLARLIYNGEDVRKFPCPLHQGRWLGCRPEDCPAGCSDGMNITGWCHEVIHHPACPQRELEDLGDRVDAAREALNAGDEAVVEFLRGADCCCHDLYDDPWKR